MFTSGFRDSLSVHMGGGLESENMLGWILLDIDNANLKMLKIHKKCVFSHFTWNATHG